MILSREKTPYKIYIRTFSRMLQESSTRKVRSSPHSIEQSQAGRAPSKEQKPFLPNRAVEGTDLPLFSSYRRPGQ